MLADCPECGLPATVTSRGRAAGTAGPVETVLVRCVLAHWFLGAADTLLTGGSARAGRGDTGSWRSIVSSRTGDGGPD
jgi:hypothetical protein